ncbi:GIY-YIG nuclease family protein [Bradyrhizobium sp. U87765 SZCCT0131]|uniref:GIY-YIG nuclease family protein n=1 Tax=unclassified Bradyrhizobium TaxID=2631580 RepID=UPI001BA61064|nr:MULTISPECIES: GIY-YIG nuclease family protein [unclassified Bradyrhizobium]MBR1220671.1 GIY-YIG nuclease family protein [Bradyrhizobium sp. U87765 SZCCT0131]MBR1262875.1 GIY-YIG nuclease family protein [Bradyrhizobium sp. U87765 SZCCT0134]MBR1307243.1 GIY-YIG nuclease family protein [Bradyrhizobium sp. U87765 SZCCT0110]MBR1322870.1 GIY-YIG nuclease family protein [Bradyrhizobium sp. U87765 SZCCT0109]MBR1346197.1 GIY-YIG nuclease family protein [Bradyrhizobium sp. U87765 SZCCT0048]
MAYYVYILASRPGGALYVGVTNDLVRRVYEHREGSVAGHTRTYNIKTLVYFETFSAIHDAIQREKNIKHWPRAYKARLITQANATWRDLYDEITQ